MSYGVSNPSPYGSQQNPSPATRPISPVRPGPAGQGHNFGPNNR
jgi:hypothetical protein